MNFHTICPLDAVELIGSHQHHMVLAQYLYDDCYYAFVSRIIRTGHWVILDSGVYEGAAVDERQLLYWCRYLRPWAVILPDKPHSRTETFRRSLSFADKLDGLQLTLPVKKFKVLHGAHQRTSDFVESYMVDSRLFDGVCFSRLTESYGLDLDTRPKFIRHLQRLGVWNQKCYHHALGMLNGSLEELKELAALGINSIDSSAPIWRGLHGRSLPRTGAEPFHIDFDPFSPCQSDLSLAQLNLEQVLSICA